MLTIVLKVMLIFALVLSTLATFMVGGLVVVGTDESLLSRGRNPARTLVSWLNFTMAVAGGIAFAGVALVLFTADPANRSRSLLLLSLVPILFPITLVVHALTLGWESLVGHPAAYGGSRRVAQLAAVRSVILMQCLFLLPPVIAWLLWSVR